MSGDLYKADTIEIIYNYVNDDLLSSVYYYSIQGNLIFLDSLIYNNLEQLIEVATINNNEITSYLYEYDETGNRIKELLKETPNSNPELILELEFDNKYNPYFELNIFEFPGMGNYKYRSDIAIVAGSFVLFNPNNVTNAIYKGNSTKYSYEYNDNYYPILRGGEYGECLYTYY